MDDCRHPHLGGTHDNGAFCTRCGKQVVMPAENQKTVKFYFGALELKPGDVIKVTCHGIIPSKPSDTHQQL